MPSRGVPKRDPDQDMLASMYVPPEIGAGVASGATPEMLAQAYEGGGLQANPVIDPTDLLIGMGTRGVMRGMKALSGGASALERAALTKAATKTERVAEFVDPSDPLGTTRRFLKHYDWEPKGKIPTVAERLSGTLDPKTAEAYAKSMRRMNNLSATVASFEDVETVLPKQAPYYRQKLKEILGKGLEGSGYSGLTKEEQMTQAAKPIPASVVKEMRSLLQEYEKDLVAAGLK